MLSFARRLRGLSSSTLAVRTLHQSKPHTSAISCKVNSADEMLEVQSSKGGVSRFPFIWLRDNCLCSDCYHTTSSSRLTSFRILDTNEVIQHAEFRQCEVGAHRLGRDRSSDLQSSSKEQAVRCLWSSGHVSHFPLEWLEQRCFTKQGRQQRKHTMDLVGPQNWSTKNSTNETSPLPVFHLKDLMGDDSVLLQWCQTMEQNGMALVKTNNREGTLKQFTNMFGFREWCSYGEFFQVENKEPTVTETEDSAKEANNLAYTGLPLEFHTDLPHYASPPQVQLLHCIEQCAVGGSNKLVDAFQVAEYMREHHPSEFELLCTVPVEYKDFHREVLWDAGPGGERPTAVDPSCYDSYSPDDYRTMQLGTRREVDFFLRHCHPIIQLELFDPVYHLDRYSCNVDGGEGLTSGPNQQQRHIKRINYSDHHRDSILNIEADKVKPFYEACILFDKLLNDDHHHHFCIWNKSEPGDILCFDNRRVLHGRGGFEIEKGGARKLEGTYLRWDEIRSLARIKASTLHPDLLL